jgi:hypothetical protein
VSKSLDFSGFDVFDKVPPLIDGEPKDGGVTTHLAIAHRNSAVGKVGYFDAVSGVTETGGSPYHVEIGGGMR